MVEMLGFSPQAPIPDHPPKIEKSQNKKIPLPTAQVCPRLLPLQSGKHSKLSMVRIPCKLLSLQEDRIIFDFQTPITFRFIAVGLTIQTR